MFATGEEFGLMSPSLSSLSLSVEPSSSHFTRHRWAFTLQYPACSICSRAAEAPYSFTVHANHVCMLLCKCVRVNSIHYTVCVCVCVCVCARARARVCVCVCVWTRSAPTLFFRNSSCAGHLGDIWLAQMKIMTLCCCKGVKLCSGWMWLGT